MLKNVILVAALIANGLFSYITFQPLHAATTAERMIYEPSRSYVKSGKITVIGDHLLPQIVAYLRSIRRYVDEGPRGTSA